MKLNLGSYNEKTVYFNRENANNGHVILLGATGSGKTTELIRLMLELVDNGMTVLAFDMNNIYAEDQIHPTYLPRFKKAVNSIEAYNDGITIPLFTPFRFSDGEEEKRVDVIDSVTEAIANTFGFGVRQKAVLRMAVEAVAEEELYAEQGIQAISGKLEKLATVKALEVRERISQITAHNIFRDGGLFIKRGKINMIRISKFSDETQRVIMEILSTVLWKYAAKEKFVNEGMYIVFDECQNMDLSRRGMIAKILVEGRKFNLNLLLSTQVMHQDAYITKMMTQASLILHFKPAKSEIKRIAQLIDIAQQEGWLARLDGLKKGEFIACGTIEYEGNLLTKPLVVSAVIPEKQKGIGRQKLETGGNSTPVKAHVSG